MKKSELKLLALTSVLVAGLVPACGPGSENKGSAAQSACRTDVTRVDELTAIKEIDPAQSNEKLIVTHAESKQIIGSRSYLIFEGEELERKSSLGHASPIRLDLTTGKLTLKSFDKDAVLNMTSMETKDGVETRHFTASEELINGQRERLSKDKDISKICGVSNNEITVTYEKGKNTLGFHAKVVVDVEAKDIGKVRKSAAEVPANKRKKHTGK